MGRLVSVCCVLVSLLPGCGGEDPGPLPQGRWEIDRAAMVQVFTTALGYPADHAANEARAIDLEMVVKADHTFQMRSRRAGQAPESAGGTWRVEGDGVLFITTHVGGQKREQPDEKLFRLTGDQLRYTPSDDYQLILRRVAGG